MCKNLSLKIDYNNVFIQGLKRGIGIYTKYMPMVYNMIVQKYAQIGELGFVVADDTLALGINMPFRATIILGYKDSVNFKPDLYKQMIGRSGRRGKDTQGHIVYVQVKCLKLMKCELPNIESKLIVHKNYRVLSSFTNRFEKNIENVFKYPINNDILEYDIKDSESFEEGFTFENVLTWKLRKYDHMSDILLEQMMTKENEYKLKPKNSLNSDINHRKIAEFIAEIFNLNNDRIQIIILNKKIDKDNYNDLVIVTEYLFILKNINDSLKFDNNNIYETLSQLFKDNYDKIYKIKLNSNDLN